MSHDSSKAGQLKDWAFGVALVCPAQLLHLIPEGGFPSILLALARTCCSVESFSNLMIQWYSEAELRKEVHEVGGGKCWPSVQRQAGRICLLLDSRLNLSTAQNMEKLHGGVERAYHKGSTGDHPLCRKCWGESLWKIASAECNSTRQKKCIYPRKQDKKVQHYLSYIHVKNYFCLELQIEPVVKYILIWVHLWSKISESAVKKKKS